MQDSKLIVLLKSLTNQEINEFSRYVNTDFFNRKTTVRDLYKELKPGLKGQKGLPTKQSLFSKIFPKEHASKKMDDKLIQKKMDSVIYDLKNLLEDYLLLLKINEPSYDRDKMLLQVYRERDVDQFFFAQFKKLDQHLETGKSLAVDYYYQKYELLNEVFNHPRTHYLSEKVQNVEKSVEYLDKFYCANKLHHAWIILGREGLAKGNKDITMIPELINKIENGEFTDDVFIQLSYLGVRSTINNDFSIETFRKMRELAFQIMPNLRHSEKVRLINPLINYCTYLIYQTSDPQEAEKSSFELSKYGFENKLLLEEGYLSYGTFFNFVIMGCRIGKFDYINQFIEENQQYLKEDARTPTVQICKGFMHQRAGKAEIALDYLNAKVNFINITDKTYEKIIRILCYYDLDEVNLLENALEAFRKYIVRQKEIEELMAKRMQKFIYFIRQISGNKHDKTALQKIYKELDGTADVVQKSWLKTIMERQLGNKHRPTT